MFQTKEVKESWQINQYLIQFGCCVKERWQKAKTSPFPHLTVTFAQTRTRCHCNCTCWFISQLSLPSLATPLSSRCFSLSVVLSYKVSIRVFQPMNDKNYALWAQNRNCHFTSSLWRRHNSVRNLKHSLEVFISLLKVMVYKSLNEGFPWLPSG